jgi:hypothetical protein
VIKTAEHLMNALTCLSVYTVGAACYMSDVKNRLFVIEEIDCTAWKDIVKPRTSGGGGEEPPPALMVPSPFAPLEDVKKMMMMEEKEQKFTLSDLLEILDGMIESDGRMIVFTTNHPENLDPALLRPGRIDMIVEFTNMTRKNVSDMYQVWFDKKPPKDVYHAMKVRGTPFVLGSHCTHRELHRTTPFPKPKSDSCFQPWTWIGSTRLSRPIRSCRPNEMKQTKMCDQTCSVCLEPASSVNTFETRRLACGHAFHSPCIMKWFVKSDSCPTCRTPQPDDPLIIFKKEILQGGSVFVHHHQPMLA